VADTDDTNSSSTARVEMVSPHPRHRTRYIVIAVIVVAVALSAVLVAAGSNPSSISGPVDVSNLPDKGPAPALDAKGWINSPPLTQA